MTLPMPREMRVLVGGRNWGRTAYLMQRAATEVVFECLNICNGPVEGMDGATLLDRIYKVSQRTRWSPMVVACAVRDNLAAGRKAFCNIGDEVPE